MHSKAGRSITTNRSCCHTLTCSRLGISACWWSPALHNTCCQMISSVGCGTWLHNCFVWLLVFHIALLENFFLQSQLTGTWNSSVSSSSSPHLCSQLPPCAHQSLNSPNYHQHHRELLHLHLHLHTPRQLVHLWLCNFSCKIILKSINDLISLFPASLSALGPHSTNQA